MVVVRCFDGLVLVCAGSEIFELQIADAGELQQRTTIDLASLATSANADSGNTENSNERDDDGENKNDATTERTVKNYNKRHWMSNSFLDRQLRFFEKGALCGRGDVEQRAWHFPAGWLETGWAVAPPPEGSDVRCFRPQREVRRNR